MESELAIFEASRMPIEGTAAYSRGTDLYGDRLDGPREAAKAPAKTRQRDELAAVRARLIERVAKGEISVQVACREGQISRARFYQLRAAYLSKGIEGLRPSYPRARLDLRLPQQVESAIVAYAILNPLHGERTIARVLAAPNFGGIKVSRHGVGEVLRRNGLSRREWRFARAAGSTERDPAPVTLPAAESNWFEEVYKRYRGYVYRVCAGRLRDPAMAEDATQETFVRLYANIGRFDSRRSILPWLKTIALNYCTDLHRRDGRVTATDPTDDGKWADQALPDDVFDSVLTNERRMKLEKSLKQLPARQKRVLLLHVLEGWSYSQIASAEEVSLQAVKSLVFRARRNLRKTERVSVLGFTIAGLRALRARLQRFAGRSSARIEMAASRFVGGIQAIEGVALALAFALAATAAPSGAARLFRVAEVAPESQAVATVGSQAPRAGFPAGSEANAVAKDLAALIGQVTDPGKEATPETTSFRGIAVSPNYSSDRTIFAAGTTYCVRPPCYALFTSRDGGTSWTRARASGLSGTGIALPPAYPADGRIFAMGASGLQVSLDEGETFSTVSPLSGSYAISPRFNKGDARILIGSPGTLMEYWPDQYGITKPSAFVIAPRAFSTVTFAPRGSSADVIFIGSFTANAGNIYGSLIDRCTSAVCHSISLPARGDPFLAFSPRFAQDRLAFAYTGNALFRSVDAGLSFDTVRLPAAFGRLDGLTSVIVQPSTPDGTALYIGFNSSSGAGTGLYRSFDRGSTWTRMSVGVKGFQFGVGALTSLGADRLLAAGSSGGLACSVDGGATWSSRCPR